MDNKKCNDTWVRGRYRRGETDADVCIAVVMIIIKEIILINEDDDDDIGNEAVAIVFVRNLEFLCLIII